MPGTNALDALAGRARSRHVVIVGGGVAGLVAALDCARVGLRVTVLEERARCGGLVRAADLDGLAVELGATAARGDALDALAREAGLTTVAPDTDATWIGGLPGAVPLPAATFLGIPANPWAADVRRVIGWRGAWRAYLDRLRPPLTIGRERSLGRLVSRRMGARVRDALVAPLAEGIHGLAPELVDVEVAAPGLNAALTRTGSLAGAVADLVAAPPAPLATVEGGLSRLVDALVARLADLGADVRTGVRATALARADDGWTVRACAVPRVEPVPSAPAVPGEPVSGAVPVPSRAEPVPVLSRAEPVPVPSRADSVPEGVVPASEDVVLDADAVIVAASPRAARALLAPVVPRLADDADPAVLVDVVALVAEAPELATAPRGARVLPVPGSHAARAVDHESARWPWLRDAGRHVVRVSFAAEATAGLDDAESIELARREASALLGVPLRPERVRAARRERLESAPPASALGARDRGDAIRAAVAAVPGLGVAGAWVSGSGIAQVVPAAAAEAERVRRTLLFGASAV